MKYPTDRAHLQARPGEVKRCDACGPMQACELLQHTPIHRRIQVGVDQVDVRIELAWNPGGGEQGILARLVCICVAMAACVSLAKVLRVTTMRPPRCQSNRWHGQPLPERQPGISSHRKLAPRCARPMATLSFFSFLKPLSLCTSSFPAHVVAGRVVFNGCCCSQRAEVIIRRRRA